MLRRNWRCEHRPLIKRDIVLHISQVGRLVRLRCRRSGLTLWRRSLVLSRRLALG